MEYRFLGNSGLQVSALSFGAWVTFVDQVGESTAYNCMKAAYDAGINFFDNAEAYADGQAEIVMGNVIKKAAWKRSDLVISTKIYWGGGGPNDCGLSRKHIFEGVHKALRRLQTDYVDLVFCHRADPDTPVEETVWAMNQVISQGKALYWGTSEWPAERIREAYLIARRDHLIPPTMEQPEYNMFKRERVEKEYAALYSEIGLGTTIWSPLASGLLTGKYNTGIPEDSRLALEQYKWLKDRIEMSDFEKRIKQINGLKEVADSLGATTAQLALAWCLKNRNVSTVITGASKPEQIEENIKSLSFVNSLTPDVIQKIEDILDNRPQPDIDWKNIGRKIRDDSQRI
ncbi:potassium channel beta subunit family protein [candidate division KSB1 bacterium]